MSTTPSAVSGAAVRGIVRSPDQVVQLLSGLIDDLQANYVVDRRKERRYPLCITVEVAACDLYGQRSGETFTAVTKDISAGGMSFLHRFPIRDQMVGIGFPATGRHANALLLLQILRRRAVGPLW